MCIVHLRRHSFDSFAFQELGNIIQKDFFPDLEKLKAQNQYLEAMEKNDVIKLRELYAKYSGKKPTNQLGGKFCEHFDNFKHSI